MNIEITKKEIEEIMSTEGEVRGTTLKTDEGFALREAGEEGIKKAEEELEKMGYPLKYSEINGMDFYPLGMRALSIIAISKALNFDEKKIIEMGISAPRSSLLIKFFMKYFLSIEKTFAKAGEMWNKHYTVGDLKPVDVNIKGRIVTLHLTGVKLHPIFCKYLVGYFSSVGKMVVQKDIVADESRCYFKGDDFHEFNLRW